MRKKQIVRTVTILIDITGLLAVLGWIFIKLDILNEQFELYFKTALLVIIILQVFFSIMRVHQRKRVADK